MQRSHQGQRTYNRVTVELCINQVAKRKEETKITLVITAIHYSKDFMQNRAPKFKSFFFIYLALFVSLVLFVHHHMLFCMHFYDFINSLDFTLFLMIFPSLQM